MSKSPAQVVFNTVVTSQENGGVESIFHKTVTVIEASYGSTLTGPPNDIHWIMVKAGPTLATGQFLIETEIEDGKRYRHPGRHRQWLLGRAAAKFLLIRQTKVLNLEIYNPADVEILRNPDGWPQIRNRKAESLPVSLTISHSDELVFCALCSHKNGSLGADLEIVAPKTESMLEDFYTQEERRRLNDLPKSQQNLAATLIWCAKEAVLKSKKTGLMENTKHIDVDISKLKISHETNWAQVPTTIAGKLTIPVWWRYIEETNLCLTLVRM